MCQKLAHYCRRDGLSANVHRVIRYVRVPGVLHTFLCEMCVSFVRVCLCPSNQNFEILHGHTYFVRLPVCDLCLCVRIKIEKGRNNRVESYKSESNCLLTNMYSKKKKECFLEVFSIPSLPAERT